MTQARQEQIYEQSRAYFKANAGVLPELLEQVQRSDNESAIGALETMKSFYDQFKVEELRNDRFHQLRIALGWIPRLEELLGQALDPKCDDLTLTKFQRLVQALVDVENAYMKLTLEHFD